MSKFQKLAEINKIANDCFEDKDFDLESKFHNEFMKIAQNERDDKFEMDKNRVAQGMGLAPGTAEPEFLANVIRISDYIRPERLKNPAQPASPNNVMLRSMAGATPENSYADEYWANCQSSFQNIRSGGVLENFKNKADYLRKAARVGNIVAVVNEFVR